MEAIWKARDCRSHYWRQCHQPSWRLWRFDSSGFYVNVDDGIVQPAQPRQIGEAAVQQSQCEGDLGKIEVIVGLIDGGE